MRSLEGGFVEGAEGVVEETSDGLEGEVGSKFGCADFASGSGLEGDDEETPLGFPPIISSKSGNRASKSVSCPLVGPFEEGDPALLESTVPGPKKSKFSLISGLDTLSALSRSVMLLNSGAGAVETTGLAGEEEVEREYPLMNEKSSLGIEEGSSRPVENPVNEAHQVQLC